MLFYIYRFEKNKLTELRLWFISRYILDNLGAGSVFVDDLSRLAKLSSRYLLRICSNSVFFIRIKNGNLYYRSVTGLGRIFGLPKSLIRGEKITKTFTSQFTSNKKMQAYICKVYMELNRDKRFKGKLTKGNTTYQAMANYFRISRKTAITNINNSTAKKYCDSRLFPEIKFANKKEFGKWLTKNMGTRLAGYLVENNPFSYYPKKTKNGYILAQQLPNRYKFTGLYLLRPKKRGKSKLKPH